MFRRLLDPDTQQTEQTGGDTGQTPQAQQPAPQQPQQPQQHQTTETPTSSSGGGDLDPNMLLQFQDSSGNPRHATLQEMIDAYQTAQSGPSVSDEDREILGLLNKAVKENDQQAAFDLVNKLNPRSSGQQTAQAPQPTGDPRVDQLNEKIQQLEQKLANTERVTSTVTQAQKSARMQNIIQQHADKLPYLAKIPVQEAAQEVLGRYDHYAGLLSSAGRNIEQLPESQQREVLIRALQESEQRIKSVVSKFGVNLDGSVETGGNPVTATDDQLPPGQNGEQVRDARYKVVNGMLVDTMSNQIVDQNAVGQIRPIPARQPEPGPSTSLTPPVQPRKTGPMSTSDLRQRLAQRAQEGR